MLYSKQADAKIEQLLNDILRTVCERIGWDYGEAWIPNQDGTILELSTAWYVSKARSIEQVSNLQQFWFCSEAFILSPGVGLPGRVWSSQQPEWILDASAHSETYFLRHYIAKAFGIKTGLGVPILVNGQVISVLVFFQLEMCEQRQIIELVMAAVQVALKNCL
ncbi:multi-sensor hybrid histidine kinase [Calothrix sp. NIES-4071]|nr:multi-sensor hybrid histidine kinase [Calothrix sp. NIES-4071]BAZ62885.1 multi-sensor hybrid histidine kinase [Calothrix sp. NIES-4105]